MVETVGVEPTSRDNVV